jgi:hypothetical protein
MTKKILLGISLILIAKSVNAQREGNISGGDCIQKGVNTVNVYYGVSLVGSIYKSVAAANVLDLNFKNVGPFGMVYEHLMTDKVGLGFEIGYSKLKMSYSEFGDFYVNGVLPVYQVDWVFSNLRAMMRINFHLVKSENFDTYILISAGFRKLDFSVTTTDPSGIIGATFSSPIPFGMKPGLGIRYFFTDNIGLHLELAAGTPIFCGGLSFKF